MAASIIRGGWGLAVYNIPSSLEHMFEKLSVINSGLAQRQTTIYCVCCQCQHYMLCFALFQADLFSGALQPLVDLMQK